MTKKLIPLSEFNSFPPKKYDLNLVGVACPECGEELVDDNTKPKWMSNPPRIVVNCPKCNYTGSRIYTTEL